VAEDRLRELFSQKGEIQDVKLMRTMYLLFYPPLLFDLAASLMFLHSRGLNVRSDGKSRQFAFIGFRTEQEAREAIRYFNKSYLDTCRIVCEVRFVILVQSLILLSFYVFFPFSPSCLRYIPSEEAW